MMPMYQPNDTQRRRRKLNMGRGNVLIADDDAAIRTVVNQALARAGY